MNLSRILIEATMHIKSKVCFLAMSILVLSACQANPSGLSPENRDIIDASSKEWVETYNKNDWNNLAALFAPDAVIMPPNGAAVRGRDAIAAWEAENEDGFRIAFDIEAINGSRDTAYVIGRSCVFIPVGNGEYGVDVGKFLEVRKKQTDGKWLIKADIFNSDLAIGADLLDDCPFADVPVMAP